MPENFEIEKEDYQDDSSNEMMMPLPSPENISPLREAAFVALVCSAQLLCQSSLGQTVPVIHDLGVYFNVSDSPGEQSWFEAAFSLTVGTFILIAGRLGDMFGYKTIFIIAYSTITVAQLLLGFTAYTTSNIFFDIMRALQGLGFSLAFPNAIALIGHYYPNGSLKKNIFMCLFGGVAPAGFVLGSIFASVIHMKIWWPWSFWVAAIVSFLVAVSSYFVIPKNIFSKSDTKFDYLGSITGVCGLILINLSWNQGSNVGWEEPYVYVLLIIGVLLMMLFFYVERKVKHPLIPPAVLNGTVGCVLLCIASGWSSFGVWLLYSFKMGLQLDHWSPLINSVHGVPCLIAGLMAAGSTAILMPRIRTSFVMTLSMIAFLVANILISVRPIGQIYWAQKFVSYIIAPFGMDMSFPAAALVLSSSLPKHQQGIAGSLVATFVNYSISIGLGIAGTVDKYASTGEGIDKIESGIRKAMYMGSGLAGLGVLSGIVFMVYEHGAIKKQANTTDDKSETKSETLLPTPNSEHSV